jgi:hypothetical protein
MKTIYDFFKSMRKHNAKVYNVIDGTNAIADHFTTLASCEVNFAVPIDAVEGWIPEGYRLVEDANHVLKPSDCIMPALDTNWRLLSTINNGARVGKLAKDVGLGIRYIATKIPT